MKKFILLLMLLFCFSLTQVEAAEKLMQCDYVITYGEPTTSLKLRVVYMDDETIIQSMPQYGDEEYTEGETIARNDSKTNFYPTRFENNKAKDYISMIVESQFSPGVMKKYYEQETSTCPCLAYFISSFVMTPVEDTSLNNGIDTVAVEGTTTLFNEGGEEVEPDLPTLTQSCDIHTDDGDINSIPGFTIQFQTYSNGDKYMVAYFSLRGESSAQRAKVETSDVIVRPMDDYGKTYTITLPAEEIDNVFGQTCLNANEIFFIEEAGIQEARYKISTDAEQAEEYGYSTSFQEGAGSVEVDLDDMDFTTGDCESYLGLITDKNDPAYYLNFAFQLLKYAAIVVLFVLTIVDFAKATTSSKDDAVKKALQTAIKRLIIAVIIFFLPMLINFILDLLGIVTTDPTCGIQ